MTTGADGPRTADAWEALRAEAHEAAALREENERLRADNMRMTLLYEIKSPEFDVVELMFRYKAVAEAAQRLTERENPWLAISPPNYAEPPVCFGCGAQGEVVNPSMFAFLHANDCAAVDLIEALSEAGLE